MSLWDGTDEEFARRVQNMIAASGGLIGVVSAYRSEERQAQLWRDAINKYGSPEKARKWVAPPGKSNHNRGVAIDLWFASDEAKNWAHENAARFGLVFPMAHEPWHIEPVGLRDGSYRGMKFDPEAYTIPPDGMFPVDPAYVNRTMEDHIGSLFSILASPSMSDSILAGPGNDPLLGAEPPAPTPGRDPLDNWPAQLFEPVVETETAQEGGEQL